jgi:DNA replication protein DnaC
MESFLSQISTLFTVYYTENTNTGNKVLDNTIIGIKCLVVMQLIRYICANWMQIYNFIIFHAYGMKNHPLELWRAPYIYPLTIIQDEFDKNFHNSYIHIIHNDNVLNLSDISIYINKLVKKSNSTQLKTQNNNVILGISNSIYNDCHIRPLEYLKNKNHGVYDKESLGLYLIAIDEQGNPVYYGTNGRIYNKNNRIYYEKIFPHLKYYLINECDAEKKIIFNLSDIFMATPNSDEEIIKKIGDISQKKTFDTLFYPQKEELIALLEKFKTKTLYPNHIPMDNKLGILLYGPPGTGKTGTISAIANYLGRNLTIINFTDISFTQDLDKILNPTRYKETIFVFDEFDCILDVLGKSEEKEDKSDWGSMLLAAEGEERKQIIEMMKSGRKATKQSINMAYLLQKLDGIESAEDRIVIATTNNPDKINTALLRPGRFDLKLCLGNCTQDMYGKILENFYKNEEGVYDRVIKAAIPDYKYSPLEIMNMAMQCNTLTALLDKKELKIII